jgi:energy-coupling factor transporter ATP-binding protein EcfA2
MIIGFAGKAASGKTTAAKHLQSLLGDTIQVLPMASMLRREVETFFREVGAADKVVLLYGDQQDKLTHFEIDENRARQECPAWDGFVVENRDIQQHSGRTTLSVRRILQWWGTEYRRAQDPDYWTKAWETALVELPDRNGHILVDDVRFHNEVDVIQRNGGVLIRVERPGFNGANDHSSENSLDDFNGWNMILCNDGSLEQFLLQVEGKVMRLLAS